MEGCGVYILEPLLDPSGVAGRDLVSFASSLPGVVSARRLGPPLPPAEDLAGEISSRNIERIILFGKRPGIYQAYFARALRVAGRNPRMITVADLSEHSISIDESPERARALIGSAVLGFPYRSFVQLGDDIVRQETLVIGGGIAGIQAALDIAGAGFKVHLVEKTGTIGGKMAKLDKTFPTLDCSACILTPKMVDLGQHPNVSLMTLSEVTRISGWPGNYRVTIRKRPRHVDIESCTACGACAEKCPGRRVDDFNEGTSIGKAIHIPFPQAVPTKYLIDEESCVFFKTGKCRLCEKTCAVGAIRLEEEEEEVEIVVGNIIVASGYDLYDPTPLEHLGYGRFENVVTTLQFERLINAAGPTGGQIRKASMTRDGRRVFLPDGEVPRAIAILHCAGSRDRRYNRHCSTVCCMASLKLAHIIKERLPECDVYEHYIDIRAYGKGYEEFFERVLHEGAHLKRGKAASVEERPSGRLLVRSEDIVGGRVVENEVDMAILAAGMVPPPDTEGLARILGIDRDEYGFLKERDPNADPVGTFQGGIYLAGTCRGPMDIPDTVAHASGAAARVIGNIMRGRMVKLRAMTLHEVETKARRAAP